MFVLCWKSYGFKCHWFVADPPNQVILADNPVVKPEDSTPLIKEPTTAHDPESV
jgi:hypothetical protein